MKHYKKIENYEDYVISDQGRVFSYKRSIFLKPRKDRCGYLFVGLWGEKFQKFLKIHRLVALAFIPNVYNKRTVNHIDGCKANNHVSNLEWNTHSENSQHGFDNGLIKPKKGIKNGQAKLNEDQVLEIRKLYKTGDYTQAALSKIFGVCFQLISLIVRRKIWTHV